MQSENPYQAPSSDLIPAAAPITSQPPFRSSLLRSGGWMSLVLLAVTIPYAVASFDASLIPPVVVVMLGIAGSVLPIPVMYALIRFVEFRYAVSNLRTLFYLVSIIGLVIGLLGIPLVLDDSEQLSPFLWIGIAGLPIYGVPYTLLGFRLKRAVSGAPTLTTLAWLMIVTGMCLTSLIFAVLTPPMSMAWCGVCAAVLFAGAREIGAAGYP